MTEPRPMPRRISSATRRTILQIAALAAICLAPGLARARRPDGSPAERKLLSLFAHRHSARGIGRQVLRAAPEFADRRSVAARLLGDIGLTETALSDTGRAVVRQLVVRRMRDDFANGRTINVDGWVLSATEARLCALAANRRD